MWVFPLDRLYGWQNTGSIIVNILSHIFFVTEIIWNMLNSAKKHTSILHCVKVNACLNSARMHNSAVTFYFDNILASSLWPIDAIRRHWSLAQVIACCMTTQGLPLIPEWLNNYIYYNVWGEIDYPFPNFNVEPLNLGNRWVITCWD